MGTAPLAGLRVVEVSSFVAAPLGGMTLAQLGAEVIRIDPVGGAADRHRWPRTKAGTSLYWAGLNKSKRSVVVNMRSEPGRDVVRGLLAGAEPGTAVVLTNAVGSDWLTHDALVKICPDLIHVQVEGHSDGSPAVDYTVNAGVGFPMITGPAGHGDPINHVLPAWDIACGLYAALGVTAAARRRDATGEGACVHVALADVALAMAGNLGFLAEAQVNNVDRQRIGNYLYGGFARDFICTDGARVMVAVLTSRHWQDLLNVTQSRAPVEALERVLEVDFGREDDRFVYREALAGLFQHWFAARTSREVSSLLAPTSLLWSPYRTFAGAVEALQTPEGSNPLFSVVDQPGVGPHLAPGSPLVFKALTREAAPAPSLGEHTRQILAEHLGLGDAAIDDLLASGEVVAHAD